MAYCRRARTGDIQQAVDSSPIIFEADQAYTGIYVVYIHRGLGFISSQRSCLQIAASSTYLVHCSTSYHAAAVLRTTKGAPYTTDSWLNTEYPTYCFAAAAAVELITMFNN